MGTYRQPAQLIDKSFEKINQSFAVLGKQMQAQLMAKQKAKQQVAEKALPFAFQQLERERARQLSTSQRVPGLNAVG